MSKDPSPQEACDECGLVVVGGSAGCQRIADEILARDYSGDIRYAAMHRLMWDTYCLQHPAKYCASAKSLAAHLAGACLILERGANAGNGDSRLQQWLSGRPSITKPALPVSRGLSTISTITNALTAAEYREAVQQWAWTTWKAYESLHDVARQWADEAVRTPIRSRS